MMVEGGSAEGLSTINVSLERFSSGALLTDLQKWLLGSHYEAWSGRTVVFFWDFIFVAAGAIIAGATRPAYPYPAYAPVVGYDPYYGYAAPYPVGCPGGYWARRQFVDQYGVVRYSRPRFFCP